MEYYDLLGIDTYAVGLNKLPRVYVGWSVRIISTIPLMNIHTSFLVTAQ